MSAEQQPSAWWLGIDLVAVSLFIVGARWTQGDGALGLLLDGLPFFAGVIVGWVVMHAWRHPVTVVWTGIGVWLIAVAMAMAIRLVVGEPVDSRFLFLTVIVLGAFLIGWRGIAWILDALFGAVPEDARPPR
ncbi:DUF3054 domain-containing protein [Marisediminicola senii]|uniref:DUF3054 domain-containing protein n=1 Tax=Marisediminicola senii TaxID=2711233 RepID=UPI0013EDDC0F|nr:DUF3054 domain-containing protein [Marisediminicola senii]